MRKIFIISAFIFFSVSFAAAQSENWYKDWAGEEMYSSLKEGQWVKYKMPGGVEVTYRVKKIEADTAFIEGKTEAGGKIMQTQDITIPMNVQEPPIKAEEAMPFKISDENVSIPAGDFKTRKISVDNQGSLNSTWFAREVPIFHYIKVEAAGQTQIELVDYGPK